MMDEMCRVKGVAHTDKPTESPDSAVRQFSSTKCLNIFQLIDLFLCKAILLCHHSSTWFQAADFNFT